MNTFGGGGASTGLQFPLYDPRSVRQDRMRFRRDSVQHLDRANSFYCPSGRWPSRGWLLLARGDLNRISNYSTALQLNIGDPARLLDNVGTLKNLSIVQSKCVTRGLAADPNALYLVEVTDARGVLLNDWFQFPLTAAYNIRVPGYPQTFYLDSMEDYTVLSPPSKTTWTWATMLKDIWNKMKQQTGTPPSAGDNLLGDWPGLPYVPAGTPEGIWFTGVPAWTALCDVLEYLGMVVACDLTMPSPFTIVEAGAADSDFTAGFVTHLEDDLEWVDTGAARVPRVVKVLFRRRNSIYGSEEVVAYRNDVMAQQWAMKSHYTVDITAPEKFKDAVGTHYLWSDFTVRYDDSSNDVDADVTTAQAIAKERASQYFAKIYRQTAGYMERTYAGALPFATGSQVDGVAWYQDYRNNDRAGWRTKIVRGPRPPFPDIYRA